MSRLSRREALAKIRVRFVEKGSPRLVVLTLIGVSGLAAFGFSALLFRLGVDHMGHRYLAATAVGYGAFILALGLWVELRRPRERSSSLDLTGLPDGELPDLGSVADVGFSGGSSGGAGASGNWAGPDVPAIDVGLGAVDADEAWPVVVAIAIAAVVLLGAVAALFYVVYFAPLLLAEVALDAALMTGIYRRLRKQDAGHWLGSAVRHTWKPAAVMAVCLFIAGVVAQWAMPTARTIGDLVR